MAGGVTCSISHEKLKLQVHTIWCQINPPSECSLPESQTKPDMSHSGCYLGPQGTCLWQMHTALMTQKEEKLQHIDVEAGFQSSKSTIAETGVGVTS